MKQPLIETIPGDALRVVESDPKKLPKGVLCTLEGPFGTTEEETENGRAYPNALWERVFSEDDFQDRLQSRQLLGEADHPEGLETSITRVSHAITKEWLDKDQNTVMGSLDVLDTPSGRIVKTLVDYGWKPGISSRGAGDIVSSSMGRAEIDPATYEYIVHDLVIDPACRRAHLSKVKESRGQRVPLTEALRRLAKEDLDEYAEQEAKAGDPGYFQRLFEDKFGIDISHLDPEPVPEPEPQADNERVEKLERRVRELADQCVDLHKQLGTQGQDPEKNTEGTSEAVKALIASYRDTRVQLDEALTEIEKLKSDSPVDNLDTIKADFDKRFESLSSRARTKAGRLAQTRRRMAEGTQARTRLAESNAEKDDELRRLRTENSSLKARLLATQNRLNAQKAAAPDGTASPEPDAPVSPSTESKPSPKPAVKTEGRRTESRKRTGPVKADVRPNTRPKARRGELQQSQKLQEITERSAQLVSAVSSAHP